MKAIARTPIALVLALTFAGSLQGCASWFEEPDQPESAPEPEYPERSMNYGVSYHNPESDVARIESGYEHSVMPAGIEGKYRDGWQERRLVMDDGTLQAAADSINDSSDSESASDSESKSESDSDDTDSGEKEGSNDKSSTSEAAQSSEKDPDPLEGEEKRIHQAWQKLCDNRLEDMDQSDYRLIQNHELPKRLHDECNEREAMGRLK